MGNNTSNNIKFNIPIIGWMITNICILFGKSRNDKPVDPMKEVFSENQYLEDILFKKNQVEKMIFSDYQSIKSYKLDVSYDKFIKNQVFSNLTWSKLPAIKDCKISCHRFVKIREKVIFAKCLIFDIQTILNNPKSLFRKTLVLASDKGVLSRKYLWTAIAEGLTALEEYKYLACEKNPLIVGKSYVVDSHLRRMSSNIIFAANVLLSSIKEDITQTANYTKLIDQIRMVIKLDAEENVSSFLEKLSKKDDDFQKIIIIQEIFREMSSFA